MRDYRKKSAKVMRHQEFRRGVIAMRAAAVKIFREVGENSMDGFAAANMVQVIDPSLKQDWKSEA